MRSEIDEQAAAGGNFPPRTPHNCALRIISEDHAGPERPLDIAALHEDQQLVAGIDNDSVSQMATLGVCRLELKQAVELALQRARVRLDRGIGEIGPTATDIAGALQKDPGANTLSPASTAYCASRVR